MTSEVGPGIVLGIGIGAIVGIGIGLNEMLTAETPTEETHYIEDDSVLAEGLTREGPDINEEQEAERVQQWTQQARQTGYDDCFGGPMGGC